MPIGRFGGDNGIAVLAFRRFLRQRLHLRELWIVFEILAARRVGGDLAQQYLDFDHAHRIVCPHPIVGLRV